MSFGAPRGKLKVNTGRPGGFGFLGGGTLTFQGHKVWLRGAKRIPPALIFMAALICLPIIFHLLATAFYLHHPIGPLLVLPFSGVLVIKKSCLLLGLTTVRDVIVSDERVEFSGTDSHGVSRTVFLLADNHLAALAIGRMLQGRSG